MMKKYLMTIAAVLCCATTMSVSAQEERNAQVTIGVNNLSYPKKEKVQEKTQGLGSVLGAIADVLEGNLSTQQKANYESAVRAAIVKGISQARRVSAIDGPLSEEEAARNGAYYVDATVTTVATTSKTDTDANKKSKTYYKGLLGVTLHMKDARTDAVVASPTFNISEASGVWKETADGAINSAMALLSSRITAYFNRKLPLSANIIEGARDKKDKQKEVYIDLGSREGAVKGLHLAVYTAKTVAGKEARKQIGKLKIEEVEGDDISLCKVQSGGKDIKTALDAGETILVQSTD